MLTPPQLWLAPHVRACHSDGQVILLDLRRNKYLGVGGAQLPALAAAIEGWPKCPPLRELSAPSANFEALLAPLLRQGLLTTYQASSRPDPSIQEATASLNGEDAIDRVVTHPGRVLRFLRSAAGASLSLRFRSMLRIVQSETDRRVHLEQRAQPVSLDAMRDAVGAYQKLRPLIFTAQDRCLHDSLALLRFLASEGIVATWVVGVRTGPFGAHAWVQSAEIVLSDQHEHVRRFQPILTA
jgi:hypothetical protein